MGEKTKPLAGRRVLVTAGPTVEDLDPVRFLSNRSTGRMGVALARAALQRGAEVILVHGPLQVPVPRAPRLQAVPVRSARQMHRAVMRLIRGTDAAILCAAVADFTPARTSPQKIKKGNRKHLVLELERTPDILAAVGGLKKRPYLVGFAAETGGLVRNALAKLHQKNCDLICANKVGVKNTGFGSKTNRVTLFPRDGHRIPLPLLSKGKAAARIMDFIAKHL